MIKENEVMRKFSAFSQLRLHYGHEQARIRLRKKPAENGVKSIKKHPNIAVVFMGEQLFDFGLLCIPCLYFIGLVQPPKCSPTCQERSIILKLFSEDGYLPFDGPLSNPNNCSA